ncbi:ABC transporter ATP-binding protein [Pseudomonas sp. LFM046]|uniref:ABC transporter ATP-binding protein n=1 Tax=Pseudomonas sp. LFM046 TaxID=1608357 RepID=UPI0005CF987B|nr:ABC transporter ATP-binding protein [Pseudomonas sp. LFM046]
MSALELTGVGFSYGARRALEQVGFILEPGSFTALLGPNGAGKSTLVALLTRLYDLQQGEIAVCGHSLRREPRKALAKLGVVFQQSTLDLDLSVEQNLAYHACLHGLPRRLAQARIERELERQQLVPRRRDKVRLLNGGHRRRVEIARALLHEPSLLLLDEASAGLDPASRDGLNRHVRQLCSDRRMAVLWTTHLLDEVRPEDRLLLLHQGRIIANDSAASLGSRHAGGLAGAFERLTA